MSVTDLADVLIFAFVSITLNRAEVLTDEKCSTLVAIILVLAAAVPAFSDDQKGAEKQVAKIRQWPGTRRLAKQ